MEVSPGSDFDRVPATQQGAGTRAKLAAYRVMERLRRFSARWLRKLPIVRQQLRLPNGRITSIQKWVDESLGNLPWDQRRTGPYYRRLRRPLRAQTNSPAHSLVSNDVPIGLWIREYEIHPELFVAVLPNARLLGPSGVVITPDNTIIQESAWIGEGWLDQDRALSALSLPKPEVLAGHYFTIASFSAEGYAHWILDALPRLSLLRYTSPAARIIVSNLTKPWQRDSLNTLGVDLNEVVVLDNRHLQLEFLHLPSYIGQPGRIHPFAVTWIRRKFLHGDEAEEPSRRFYLTRSSGRRRVMNEDELEPILRRYGFEIIDPGTLTFQQQVHLFSRAAAIVGPHGAGLTNCIFAPRGCRIFELFARTCVRPMYHQLTSVIGQTYWYLIGRESRDITQTDPGFDDMWISPEEFERTLAAIFRKSSESFVNEGSPHHLAS